MSLQKKNNEKGFSIIELMIVIVIIGLMAGIVGVRVMDRLDQAKVTRAKADIESFRAALKLYRLDNGTYPSNEQGLQALVTKPETGTLPRKWREGGYLEINRIPKDPWGNEYYYQYPGLNGEFDIISYGNDREPGGEETDADVTSWEDI